MGRPSLERFRVDQLPDYLVGLGITGFEPFGRFVWKEYF